MTLAEEEEKSFLADESIRDSETASGDRGRSREVRYFEFSWGYAAGLGVKHNLHCIVSFHTLIRSTVFTTIMMNRGIEEYQNNSCTASTSTRAWMPASNYSIMKAAAIIQSSDAREYSWVGEGIYVMYNVLNHGQLLLCQVPEQNVMYLWEHPPARSYVSGPLCVVGDAKHAAIPWHGSGGAMSIEDSLIISTLLGRAKSPVEAEAALQTYDQEIEMKKFGNLLPSWDFILNIDMLEHHNEAIQKMQEELAASA
ncbi:hypothetical protein GGS21DRAFT_491568 [Xylaria nigripes]|nr:hypothetical protein GGS21DRAFT_491568 [Xylaria nigripes]